MVIRRLAQGVKAFAREVTHPYAAGGTTGVMRGDRDWFRSWVGDPNRSVGDGSSNDIVMGCIRWLATNYTTAPLLLARRDADDNLTPEPNHPMLQLLNRPNEHWSRRELWWATLASLILDGNAYWLKVRNRATAMTELWYMPHRMMRPCWKAGGFIDWYEYRPNTRGGSLAGQAIKYDPAEIVHLRYGRDMHNVRLGCSPLKTAMTHVLTDQETAEYTAYILHNRGVPGAIISPRASDMDSYEMEDEEIQRFATMYEEETTGKKRGRVLGINVPIDVKTMSFNPRELDLSVLRSLPETRIPAALGLNASVLGLFTGIRNATARATLDSYRAQAWQDCLIPLQSLIDEQLIYQLLAEFEDDVHSIVMSHDYSMVPELQENQEAKTRRLSLALMRGAITRAEFRQEFGYEVTEADDVFMLPSNVVLTPREATAADAAVADTDEAEASEEQAIAFARIMLAEYKPEKVGAAVNGNGHHSPPDWVIGERKDADLSPFTEQEREYIAYLDSEAERLGDVLEAEMVDAFDTLASLVEPVAAEYRHEVVAAVRLGSEKQGPTDYLPGLVELPDALAAVATQWGDDYVAGVYEGHWLRVTQSTLDGIESVFGLGINLPDEVAREVIAQGGKRLGLLDLSEAAKRRVFQTIGDGIAAGRTPDQIIRDLANDIPRGRFASARVRAKTIARTEIKHAQNVSSMAAYRQSPLITTVKVVDGQMATSDLVCVDRNGTTVSLTEADSMLADEHPNGTLNLVPVVSPS